MKEKDVLARILKVTLTIEGASPREKQLALRLKAFFIIVRTRWSEGLFIHLNSFCFVTLIGILRCLQLLVLPHVLYMKIIEITEGM